MFLKPIEISTNLSLPQQFFLHTIDMRYIDPESPTDLHDRIIA